jgi:predicted HicB family RNase H-like nuclease
MVSMNYEIPDELHRAVKVLAAQRGMTVKALLIEALQQIVETADTKEKQ